MAVIGVGVDLEAVSAFRKRKSRVQIRLLSRVFSERERAYCSKFRDPAPHLAARFCAKEALVKAARGSAPIQITDAEVVNRADGSPHFRARNRKAYVRRFFQRNEAWLSVTHTKETAMAFVVVVKKGRGRRK